MKSGEDTTTPIEAPNDNLSPLQCNFSLNKVEEGVSSIHSPVSESDALSDDDMSSDLSEKEQLLPKQTNGNLLQANNAPKDRLKLVYLIFYLLGIGSLLPWNFFSTAKEYFIFKLRNTTFPDEQFAENETELQRMFEGYLAIAAMLPNVLFMFLNTVATKLIPLKARIILATIVMLVLFAFTIVLSKLNTDSWQAQFFAVTLVTVVIMNAGSAILQGGMFGLSSLFPEMYSQAVMAGMGMGGTLAAVANIIVLLISKSPLDSGFGYFMTAEIVLFVALGGFLCLPLSKFARYHTKKRREITKEITVDDEDRQIKSVTSTESEYSSVSSEAYIVSSKIPLVSVFKQIWVYALSVFFIFLVTLSCYPAVNSAIRSMEFSKQTLWGTKLFVPVSCFLIFNLGDLVGRTLAGVFQFPKIGSPLMPIFAMVRLCFVPLFMMCNIQPHNHMPFLFHHDAWPIALMAVFALSNGYLGTLCMMYGPKLASLEDAETAGAMMSFFLSLGLSMGSLFSFVILQFI